jgi:Cft2 family RNA processing exonuclease
LERSPLTAKRKRESFMRIGFLGATRQVMGSSYFLDAGGLKILVDCGLFQERHYSDRNGNAFPVPPGQIDHLLLNHVHLDHSGLIPKLVKEGFAGDLDAIHFLKAHSLLRKQIDLPYYLTAVFS